MLKEKIILPIYGRAQIKLLSSKGKAFSIAPRFLSRFSQFSFNEFIDVINMGKGKTLFLQWDILMTESTFQGLRVLLKKIPWHEFSAIRIQDPGAIIYLQETLGDKCPPIHFITEQGNHNLLGLKEWVSYWPSKITRLVLSPEIPKEVIENYAEHLDVEIELLAAGKVLLFYTPRHLIAPLYGNTPEEGRMVYGTSEESPHKGFPILENGHGTFMFNTKELFLLSDESFYETCSIYKNIFLRVEGESGEQIDAIIKYFEQSEEKFDDNWSSQVTKGFFRVNKTNILFKKLKNQRRQNRDQNYIGSVVDVKKKTHVGILLSKKDYVLRIGDQIRLLSPEGREKMITLNVLRDADGIEIPEVRGGEVFFIPSVGGISVKSMVFDERVH